MGTPQARNRTPARRPRLPAWLCAGFALALASLGTTQPAAAQSLVALVNGSPITAGDVSHRTRLLTLLTRKQPSRQDVIDELVNEQLKLHQARRLGISVTDQEVDRAFAVIAQQSGRSAAEFNAAFQQAQVSVRSFKTRLRAELAWRQVLQQQSPGAFHVRDADIVAVMAARGERLSGKAVQYTLRQFVFVVPRNAPASVRTARQREAEAFRQRVSDCETAVQIAREHAELVTMDPVIRLSTDLPARLQQLLAQTPDGRLTPPETVAAGFEVVAVCGRKETFADVSTRRELREELVSKRLEAHEKKVLEQLRRQAIIEFR